MDSTATAVGTPLFTPDQIKRRKLANLKGDESNVTTTPKTSLNPVEVSKDDDMMDSSCGNVHDINCELVDDSSKRYANPDAPIQTIQDMMNSISAARFARKDLMVTATIDQLTNRIQLLTTSNSKANLKHLYGYDDQGNTYLNPEEALYLLETGKLEICINGIPISIIKARALFLNGCSTWLSAERPYDGTTCTDEEYAVYKYLASHGYRLRRCKSPSDPIIRSTTSSTTTCNKEDTLKVIQNDNIHVIELEDVEMKSSSEEGLPNNKESLAEKGEELEALSPKAFGNDTSQQRGLKRKRLDVDPLSLNEPEALDIELDDMDLTKEQPISSSSSAPKVFHIPINIEGATVSSTSAKEEETGEKGDMIVTSMMVSSTSQSGDVIEIYDDSDDDGEISQDKVKEKSGSKFTGTYGEAMSDRELEPIFEIGDDYSNSSSSSTSSVKEPTPSTSRGLSSSNDPYTVVEVDSDVEFIDEVSFESTQVEIQEVDGFAYDSTTDVDEDDCPCIEEEEEDDDDDDSTHDQTNVSTGPRTTMGASNSVQLIDLVSSDNEEEENEETKEEEVLIKKFATDIWSKFVPNSVIQLGFPPASLLPKEIHRETTVSNTYEFNMKDQGDQSDLELETIVDELKIDGESEELPSSSSNNNKSSSASPSVKNWKQWRQHFVQEAHEIFKTSLLGGGLEGQGNQSAVSNGRIFSDDVVERLNLWQKRPTEKEEEKMELNCNGDHNNMDSCGSGDDEFTFYLYAPTDKKVHRIKLGSAVKPTHRILIARNADLVPDMAAISQRGSENIPILIALVQDDCEVTFVATDFTPVTSLF